MPWMLYQYIKPRHQSYGLVRFVKQPARRGMRWFTTAHNAPSNDPNRAKGMRAFTIRGFTVYAGTIGGARKLRRRLLNYHPQ